MFRVMCDGCGKELRSGDDRHVVKIEVYAARNPNALTEEDLDEDHMEAVSELLRELENNDETADLEPANRHLRYDLCCDCRKRYLRDPLGKEVAPKFLFSKN
jgi:hypothetical protein